MLQALYIVAFGILAVLTIANLIRNLMLLGADARRGSQQPHAGGNSSSPAKRAIPHPEMLDARGQVIDEPLLVMKSISLEDAREKLDALYDASASPAEDSSEDSDAK